MPTKKDILDLYFIDARHKLIDIAAFLDRIDRHDGDADFRVEAMSHAIQAMLTPGDHSRAEAVLLALSDHSSAPIEQAPMQGALGAVEESGDGGQGTGGRNRESDTVVTPTNTTD